MPYKQTPDNRLEGYVREVDFELAYTVLTANSAETPVDLQLATNTLLGRLTGNIAALTGTQVAGIIPHNSLSGLQGGQSNEYYHLTAAEYSGLQTTFDDCYNNEGGAPTVIVDAGDVIFDLDGDYSFIISLLNTTNTGDGFQVNNNVDYFQLNRIADNQIALVSELQTLDINIANVFSIDGASASNVSVTGAGLTISTITSGTLAVNSAGSLVFSDGNKSGSTYSGAFALSSASSDWDDFEVNFGEVSLLEALNALGDLAGLTNLDDAYNNHGGAAGIAVDAGSVTWTLDSTYDFIIDLTSAAAGSRGFLIEETTGSDYIRAETESETGDYINWTAEVRQINFNSNQYIYLNSEQRIALNATDTDSPVLIGTTFTSGDQGNLVIQATSADGSTYGTVWKDSGETTVATLNSDGDFVSAATISATTAKLSDLTDGYLPYHVSDAVGLADSGIFWDNGSSLVGIGTVAPDYKLDVNGISRDGDRIIGDFSTEPPQVIYVGDSLTYGYGGTNPYTFYISLPAYNGLTITETNIGVNSRELNEQMLVDWDELNPLFANHGGLNLVVVWLGSNDMAHDSTAPEQVYCYLRQYCRHQQLLGRQVAVMTMISRSGLDADKNVYNGLIRGSWPEFSDLLIDLAANSNIGADGAYSNPTYFSDGVHLTDAGYALVGSLVDAALDDYINGLVLRGTLSTYDYGGIGSGANKYFSTTTHATKGKFYFGDYIVIDEVNTRLGVNVTSPSYTLDIDGDFNISEGSIVRYGGVVFAQADTADNNFFTCGAGNITTTGYGNTGAGSGAAASLGTSSSGNTMFGYQSGQWVTNNCSWNCTHGYRTARVDVPGNPVYSLSGCTYIGSSIRASADGVSNEIGIGYSTYCLGSNTVTVGNSSITATYLRGNTAIGTTDLGGTPAIGRLVVKGSTNNGSTNCLVLRDSDEANVLWIDTDGGIHTDKWLDQDSNTFIGVDVAGNGALAHSAGNDGYMNTGLGNGALYSISTGYSNIGLGYQTLYTNTTSDYNSAMGHRALYYITGGSNTALGAFAGYGTSGSTAANNTLVGYYAGFALQTGGDNNTLLGYSAGDNITTGASNIIIGVSVDAPSATADNQLNIGDALYGDLSVGNLGVGAMPLTNMAAGDLLLEGGSLVLKEITTPTADTNYGKVYTKSDNKLYFQDGGGTEHEIAFV